MSFWQEKQQLSLSNDDCFSEQYKIPSCAFILTQTLHHFDYKFEINLSSNFSTSPVYRQAYKHTQTDIRFL